MRHQPALFASIFALAAILTAAAYAPGLGAPPRLDDRTVLGLVADFLHGELTTPEVLDAQHSGPLGRPLSVFSFVLGASVHGGDLWAIHAINLALHLICAYWVWQLVALLARAVGLDRPQATLAALLVSALWVSSPIFVTTVLYGVQRMAQLSTLFVLVGLTAYLRGRMALADGKPLQARLQLYAVFPIALALGLLAKENAAVLLPITLAVALLLYPGGKLAPALRREIQLFHLGIAAAVLAGTVHVLASPGSWMELYRIRDFTLVERLMTEARILWDYLAQLLVPGKDWGIVHDDYPVSRGLLQPATTFLALLGWAGVLAGIVFPRLGLPRLTRLGMAFYLLGHSVESSFVPLELYFEHRNYLPAVGAYVALLGVLELPVARRRLEHPAALIVFLVPLVFLAMTFGRASLWADPQALAIHHFEHHPGSRRAHVDIAQISLAKGDYEPALYMLRRAAELNPFYRAELALTSALAWCRAGHLPNDSLRERLAAIDEPVATNSFVAKASQLSQQVARGRCPTAWARTLNPLLERTLAGDRRSTGDTTEFKLISAVAMLQAEAGNRRRARELLEDWLADGATDRRNALSALILLASLSINEEDWDSAAGYLDCFRERREGRGLYLLANYSIYRYLVSREAIGTLPGSNGNAPGSTACLAGKS